jgi:uncharacterized membrane protein
MKQIKNKQNGFAGAEIVLVIILIAVVAGVGVWVVKKHNTTKTANSTPVAANTAKPVASQAIDNLLQGDAGAEEAIDKKNQTSEQNDAASANAAGKNIGGAYDENTL